MIVPFVTSVPNAEVGGKVTRTGSSLRTLRATHQTTPMRSRSRQLGRQRCHLSRATERGALGTFASFTRAAQIGRRLTVQRERIDMPNLALDRMTRSAISRLFQFGR